MRPVEELIAELEAKLAAKFAQQTALTELQQEIDRLMAVLLGYPSVQLPLLPDLTDVTLSNLSVDPNAVHNEIVGLLTAAGGDGTWLWAISGGGGVFELSSTAGIATILERSASGTLTPGGTVSVDISCTSDGIVIERTFIINIDTLPTDIALSASTITTTAPSGTIVGVLSTTGGKVPLTYAVTVNTKFTTSGANLVRSGTGTLTDGVPESVTVRVTDANANTFNKIFSVTVTTALAGVQLTAFDVTDWSGAGSVGFWRGGMPFTKGDIPAGRVPQIRLSGTPLTAVQFDNQVYWDDGSLAFCTCCANLGTFTAAQAKSYTLWSITGTYNNTGTKALSDITAQDFNETFTSFQQHNGTSASTRGSGSFVASFNTHAAVATRCWKYESGPVAESWEVWGPAQDGTGGAPDPHLTVVWYVTIWKNTDGTIADYEYCAVNSQFWWSVANKFRLLYTCVLKKGASTIETYASVNHPYRSMWATVRKTADNNRARRFWVTAIPSLLYQPDTDYWVETGYVPPLDTSYTPNASNYSTAVVPCQSVNHRAAVDGTGAYMGRGLMPNSSCLAFLNQTAQSYQYDRANAFAGLHITSKYRSNNTRTRPASAGCPGGDATPDTAATIISLKLAPLAAAEYDFTADGMPAAVDAYIGAGTFKDGYVSPLGGSGVWTFTGQSDSHGVAYSYFMYLHEGERYFMQACLDLSAKSANSLASNDQAGGGRPNLPYYYSGSPTFPYRSAFNIPSTVYSGIANMGFYGNYRHIGWGFMLMGQGWAVCPANDPQHNYFRKYVTHNVDYLLTAIQGVGGAGAYMPASQLASGAWLWSNPAPWWGTITTMGLYYNYQLTKLANVIPLAEFSALATVGLVSTHIYRSTLYLSNTTPKCAIWAAGANEFFAPQDTPNNQVEFSIGTNDVLTATLLSPGNGFPLTNGDILRPVTLSYLAVAAIPAELTEGTAYYVIEASGSGVGSTCKISATPGGAAVNFTSSYADSHWTWYPAAMNNYATWSLPPFELKPDDYGNMTNAAIQIASKNGNAAATAQRGKCNTFFAGIDDSGWVTWRLRA